MKRFFVLAILVIISSTMGFSQPPDPARMNPERMAKEDVSELLKEFSISVSKQDSLKTELVRFYTQVKKCIELRNLYEMHRIGNDRDEKVKTLLSKSQYDVYLKFMEKKKKQRRSGSS